jgi:hypothetical protein
MAAFSIARYPVSSRRASLEVRLHLAEKRRDSLSGVGLGEVIVNLKDRHLHLACSFQQSRKSPRACDHQLWPARLQQEHRIRKHRGRVHFEPTLGEGFSDGRQQVLRSMDAEHARDVLRGLRSRQLCKLRGSRDGVGFALVSVEDAAQVRKCQDSLDRGGHPAQPERKVLMTRRADQSDQQPQSTAVHEVHLFEVKDEVAPFGEVTAHLGLKGSGLVPHDDTSNAAYDDDGSDTASFKGQWHGREV